MDNNQMMVMGALAVLLFILLFVILREFMCWYWKINKIVDVLNEINDRLKDSKITKISSEDYF